MSIHSLDKASLEVLAQFVRDMRERNRSNPDSYDTGNPRDAIRFRIGKTTTNSDFPTYPGTGDTFVVALGELSWTESTGTQTNTWTAYSPSDTRLCHDVTGQYWAENSYVQICLHHGRWFIVGGASALAIPARVTAIGSTATANTVTAEKGTFSYTSTVGRQTLSFTADSPQSTITVHEMSGHGPPPRVNDLILAASIGGKYYILKTNARHRLKAKVGSAAGIALNSSGPVVVWVNGAATTRTETAHLNWMATAALAYNKMCIIEWFDDEQKWVIVSAEC